MTAEKLHKTRQWIALGVTVATAAMAVMRMIKQMECAKQKSMEDKKLDKRLKETFPSSDPVAQY